MAQYYRVSAPTAATLAAALPFVGSLLAGNGWCLGPLRTPVAVDLQLWGVDEAPRVAFASANGATVTDSVPFPTPWGEGGSVGVEDTRGRTAGLLMAEGGGGALLAEDGTYIFEEAA